MTSKRESFDKQYDEQAEAREQARRFTANLIADFEGGEIVEGYTYGGERMRTETFLLAGNGPTAYAVFVLDGDGDVWSAYVEYTTTFSVTVALPDWIAEDLYAALRDT